MGCFGWDQLGGSLDGFQKNGHPCAADIGFQYACSTEDPDKIPVSAGRIEYEWQQCAAITRECAIYVCHFLESIKTIYNEKEIIYNSLAHGPCGGDRGYFLFLLLPEREGTGAGFLKKPPPPRVSIYREFDCRFLTGF